MGAVVVLAVVVSLGGRTGLKRDAARLGAKASPRVEAAAVLSTQETRERVEPEKLGRVLRGVSKDPMGSSASPTDAGEGAPPRSTIEFRAFRPDGTVLARTALKVTINDGRSRVAGAETRTDELGFAVTEPVETRSFRRQPMVYIGWAGDDKSGGPAGAIAHRAALIEGLNDLGDIVLMTSRDAHPVPVLAGRMVDAKGEPIAGATALADLPGCRALQYAFTGHEPSSQLWAPPAPGREFVPQVPSYTITESDQEGRFSIFGPDLGNRTAVTLLGAPEHQGLAELRVERDDVAEVLWRARPCRRVVGRFLWPAGFDSEGYFLTHQRRGSEGRRLHVPVPTASDGSFAVLAGVEPLSLNLGGGLEASSSFSFWSWSFSSPEWAASEETLDLGEIDMRQKFALVELEVLNPGGKPLATGTLGVNLLTASLFARSDAAGRPAIVDGFVEVWLPRESPFILLQVQPTGPGHEDSQAKGFGPFLGLWSHPGQQCSAVGLRDKSGLVRRLVLDAAQDVASGV